jgi:hypothetical protein
MIIIVANEAGARGAPFFGSASTAALVGLVLAAPTAFSSSSWLLLCWTTATPAAATTIGWLFCCCSRVRQRTSSCSCRCCNKSLRSRIKPMVPYILLLVSPFWLLLGCFDVRRNEPCGRRRRFEGDSACKLYWCCRWSVCAMCGLIRLLPCDLSIRRHQRRKTKTTMILASCA